MVHQLRTSLSGLVSTSFVSDDPVSWIEDNFYIPETPDHHIVLGAYQRAALRQALTRNGLGEFPYSVVVWSDIKKSIKSCVAAAVGLWRAFNTPWGSIKVVANDMKQADSRVMFYMRRCIELNPNMRSIVNIKNMGHIIELPNRARIEAIPVDPSGEAGGNDDMIIFSELWAAKHASAQRMWTEMTLSPTKFGQSFRWVETYAGFSGESPLLEQLYQSGTREGSQFEWAKDFDPELECYENGRMFCLWNTEPRLPWQNEQYYSQEASILTPGEFERVHRNKWSASTESFVPIEWWDKCKRDPLPALEKDQPMVMGVDAAISGDCFAVVLISGTGDGETMAVRYSRAWKPPKHGKIDFQEVETEIKRLLVTYNVIEVAYDPYQLEDMAGRLRKELTAYVTPFNQGKDRLIADKGLYDMIRDRRILHSGDPDLREHVQNANAKSEDGKLRLIKRNELMKIDLTVATSMATARAVHWRI